MLLNILNQFQSEVNHAKFSNANKWLETLYNKKSQWAARWTWGHLTMGAHSTQRSEAVNSSIKHFLNSHTLLTELVTKIEEYRETITDQSEGKAGDCRVAISYAFITKKWSYVPNEVKELD